MHPPLFRDNALAAPLAAVARLVHDLEAGQVEPGDCQDRLEALLTQTQDPRFQAHLT